MLISVVIPVKNRENTIKRAVKSVFSQKGEFEIEIIIVDDGSTDDTVLQIQNLMLENKQIHLIQNKRSLGGAIARNIGAKKAIGEFIAFLDSDDEWLPEHLFTGLQFLQSEKAQGCFSAFNIYYKDKVKYRELPKLKENEDVTEYKFSRGGDMRTSTFIFKKEPFLDVLFDEKMAKHQDWDLAICFGDKYKLVANIERTVNIYTDVLNRMSNANNYKASDYFLNKHIHRFSPQSLFKFKLSLCFNTFKFEGGTDDFFEKLQELKQLAKREDVKIKEKKRYYALSNSFNRTLLKVALKIKVL